MYLISTCMFISYSQATYNICTIFSKGNCSINYQEYKFMLFIANDNYNYVYKYYT